SPARTDNTILTFSSAGTAGGLAMNDQTPSTGQTRNKRALPQSLTRDTATSQPPPHRRHQRHGLIHLASTSRRTSSVSADLDPATGEPRAGLSRAGLWWAGLWWAGLWGCGFPIRADGAR
ncbi:hypothetical protein, partial [Nocardia farcinica]|uniref:hypothetical protein n=1 Tax=Nocardia farcinica TaxID=37329 RepID=UPI0024568163